MKYQFTMERGFLRADLLDRETAEGREHFLEAVVLASINHRCSRILVHVRLSNPLFTSKGMGFSGASENRVGSVAQNRPSRDTLELGMSHDYVSLLRPATGGQPSQLSNGGGGRRVAENPARVGRAPTTPDPAAAGGKTASAIPTRASQGFASSADAAPKAAFRALGKDPMAGRGRMDSVPEKNLFGVAQKACALVFRAMHGSVASVSPKAAGAATTSFSIRNTSTRTISTPRAGFQALQDRFQPAVELGGEESSRALRGRTEKPETARREPDVRGVRHEELARACRVQGEQVVANRKSAACTMARLVRRSKSTASACSASRRSFPPANTT